MEYLTAVLLLIACLFAFMRAFQNSGEVDFGWIAVGLVIAALFLAPSLGRVFTAVSHP